MIRTAQGQPACEGELALTIALAQHLAIRHILSCLDAAPSRLISDPYRSSYADAPPRDFAMSSDNPTITSVLKETRTFPPPPDFVAKAAIKSREAYQRLFDHAKDNPEDFWAEQAESLAWIKRWDKVLVWNEPHAQWFVGGKLNVSAQLPRPSSRRAAPQQGRAHLGRRTRRLPSFNVSNAS